MLGDIASLLQIDHQQNHQFQQQQQQQLAMLTQLLTSLMSSADPAMPLPLHQSVQCYLPPSSLRTPPSLESIQW